MPLLLVPLVLIGVVLLVLLLIPLGMLQRYRVGVSRQKARGCLALGNTIGFALSALLLVATALITSFWEPRALPYVAVGILTGAALGGLGLLLSRWEETAEGLYVTPRRWLILTVVLVVATRFAYGIWRAWNTVASGPGEETWLAAAGVPGSMAAGAVVIGYSLVFWLGVRRRVSGFRQRRDGQLGSGG